MKRVKDLIIRTKKAVFNEYLANHPSLFDGDGLDFSELREYKSGDDAKRIDHKTTAKKQKPYIKVYKSERELNIAVFNLLGGSVFFGTKLLKQEFIARILSIIGVSAISYQDRFSSYIYTDKVEEFIKPSKKLQFVSKAVELVFEFKSVGKRLDFKELEREIKRYVKKRSIIFFIGDFFDIYDFRKLNTFHEVIVIIVRDRFEERLKELSLINFSDASTKKSIQVDIDQKFIKEYRQKLHDHDLKLYDSLKKARVRFVKIYTDENPIKKLRKLFLGLR